MADSVKGKCRCEYFVADYGDGRTDVTFNGMHVLHNITHCKFMTKRHRCTNTEAILEFAIEEL